jgi:hypothetical protein
MVRRIGLILLLLSTLILAACGGGSGLPTQPGRYTLKDKSISFDGDRYSFMWADATGALHPVKTDDVKLQLDEKNELEITADKHAVLHLKQDEPVTVEGRDRQGDFGNFWYPFLIGSMLSRGSGPVIVNNPPPEYRQPVYRYPPTDRFDRGDTIGGSVTSSAPRPPDYNRMQPVGGAVSGQNGGAGGGNAAINKSETAATSSGQSGGSGSGSAALNKTGSFRSGNQGYDAKVGAGSVRSTGGSSGPSITTGRGSSSGPSISTGSRSSGSTPKISTGRRR